jgi:4-amino-4-deoxy-L-arabinose transferase-like glycosyltransferase
VRFFFGLSPVFCLFVHHCASDSSLSTPLRPMFARALAIVSDPARARRLFFVTLLVLTSLRAGFSAWLPLTGDEAYFSFWGLEPDWGFYDHPPMVGWWLAPLAALSLEPFVLRLPALLAPPVIAAVGVIMLRPYGAARAWSAGALVLLLPLNVWNVAITTDIPLMVFSALAMLFYLRAHRSGRGVHFLLAGLMLGGALLSKYFAGLLAIAILVHSLQRRDRARSVDLLWVVLGALPAALIQIPWNWQNCWPNLMFNLVNRHEGDGWSWVTPLLFLVSAIYVLTPAVAWRVLRGERGGPTAGGSEVPAGARAKGVSGVQEGVGAKGESERRASGDVPAASSLDARLDLRVLRTFVLVPFAVFALLSTVKTIGLHWLASFTLPGALAFVLVSSRRALARGLVAAGAFAVAHWALIAVLAALPTETYRNWASYPGLVMTLHADELSDALEPWRGRFVIAASGYSPAVTLGHTLGEYVFVFGPGSSHARHDDILTDVRELAGKDILIVRKDGRFERIEYEPYFERVEYRTIELRGVYFQLIEGYGFRYEAYRDIVLEEIRERWYAVPEWLPDGPCYFCDRYFPERSCHR